MLKKVLENGVSIVLDYAEREKLPISCTLEITTICNFNCVHCYLRNNHKSIMSFNNAKKLIDEIKENGGLFLTLTGGEVLTHPQFAEIYEYAYQKGFIITVLTNGYFLSDSILNLFVKMPPRKIEITIYGYHQSTFEKTTETNYKAEKVLQNIMILIKNNFNVLVKTILLQENKEDFFEIRRFAKKIPAPFMYEVNVLPTTSGSREVLKHQLEVDEVLNIEMKNDSKIVDKWAKQVKYYNYNKNRKTNCGCGRFSYMITADMFMRKCNFITQDCPDTDLKRSSIKEVWKKWSAEKNVYRYKECMSCIYQSLCDICPSVSYALTSTKEKYVPIERLCEFARKKMEYVEEYQNECNYS